jgi:hypothetical protein
VNTAQLRRHPVVSSASVAKRRFASLPVLLFCRRCWQMPSYKLTCTIRRYLASLAPALRGICAQLGSTDLPSRDFHNSPALQRPSCSPRLFLLLWETVTLLGSSDWRVLADWDGPGKAEPARLAFAVKKVDFEDVLLTGSTWTELKPTTPWGQVPVLEVDGEKLAQSGVILSYLGRELGLYPGNALAAAKVDEFCDTVEECVAVCLAAAYDKDVSDVLLQLLSAARVERGRCA